MKKRPVANVPPSSSGDPFIEDPASIHLSNRNEVFGPSGVVGPFPADSAEFTKWLDRQPPSPFQIGLASALRKYLKGFRFEMSLSDGVPRRVHLREKHVEELERRRVIEYLSRLLLVYSDDDPEVRKRRRPDTIAGTFEAMADTYGQLAKLDDASHDENRAAEHRRIERETREAARRWSTKQGIKGPGRTRSLPKKDIVRTALEAIEAWASENSHRRTSRPGDVRILITRLVSLLGLGDPPPPLLLNEILFRPRRTSN